MWIFFEIDHSTLLIRAKLFFFLQQLRSLLVIKVLIFQFKYSVIRISRLRFFCSLNRCFKWYPLLVIKRQNIDSDTVNILLLKNRHWACYIFLQQIRLLLRFFILKIPTAFFLIYLNQNVIILLLDGLLFILLYSLKQCGYCIFISGFYTILAD